MIAEPARNGAVGFDTDTPLTAALCQSLPLLDYEFAIRYVSHAAPRSIDLTATEAQMITDAGMALMVVMHPLAAGWSPSASLGLAHGKAVLRNLPANLPSGMAVWCDLEGLAQTPNGITCSYVNSWSAIIRNAGWQPGLYVGYDTWLTGEQLYENLTLNRYWKSASNVPSSFTARVVHAADARDAAGGRHRHRSRCNRC